MRLVEAERRAVVIMRIVTIVVSAADIVGILNYSPAYALTDKLPLRHAVVIGNVRCTVAIAEVILIVDCCRGNNGYSAADVFRCNRPVNFRCSRYLVAKHLRLIHLHRAWRIPYCCVISYCRMAVYKVKLFADSRYVRNR